MLLLGSAACSNDDANLRLELTPTIACNEAASHSEAIGLGDRVELVRAERTTGKGLRAWLVVRHGAAGPAQTASPTIRSDDLVDVCVFRGSSPRPISVPPGSSIDTAGVRVLVRFGGVTLDAVGAPDQLARELDNLPGKSR